MNLIKKIVLFLIIFLFSPAAGICRGESEPEKKPQDKEYFQLEPMTVTAQKTEEDVQKIPASITALSGIQLEDSMAEDTNELTRMVPNVYQKASTAENTIIIRGITSFETSVYSPTAVYVDDLMIPTNYGHLVEMLDIERVEVLRGPQGSLYGGNSEAGVVNIITRRPDNDVRLKLYGGIGSYASVDDKPLEYNISLNAAGPILSDRLYLGVAGSWKKGDGFLTNLYYDDDTASKVDHKNFRAVLRWTPTTSLDISLTGDILDNDDGIAVFRFDDGPYRTDPYTVNRDTKDFQEESGHSQNLRVAYTGEKMKFFSVTGHRDYTNENLQDYDCTADQMNDWGSVLSVYKNHILSQEFRLSPVADDIPFTWLAGLYAFKEKTDIDLDNATLGTDDTTKIDITGYAVFGEGTYALSDRLDITAGLRFDTRRAKGSKTGPTVNISDTIRDKKILPKLSLGYDINDTTFSYFTVSRGYLSGGFNYLPATSITTFTYDPEYTMNCEAGIKTSWFDRRLQANLALFYIDMTDKQTTTVVTGLFESAIENAAKARSKGIELELQTRPARGWEVFAGFGYTDAEYIDWIATEWNSDYTGLTQNDYSGKTVAGVPEYTGHLGVQYRHTRGLFVRADVNGVGPVYADQANRIKEDAYALVNLQLGYETEYFDVVLWGKNIFDTEYYIVSYDWDGLKLVQDGNPAMFGLRITLRFSNGFSASGFRRNG